MKLLIFSDIHNDWKALERLMAIEADYYFAAGDTVTWAKGFDDAGEILKRRGDRVLVLPGNHESETDIHRLCENFGLRAFHGQTKEIDGWHIAGLGYSNPTPFKTPGEYSEAEMAIRLAAFAGLKPMILICHCPPKDTPLDRMAGGAHIGSTAVADFVRRHAPAWVFCGHVHEAEGVTATLGKTRGANVGKKGYLLDFATLKA